MAAGPNSRSFIQKCKQTISRNFFRLGNGKFITQSLLILVEDVNDNVPVFEPHTPSILVREHSSTPLQLISLVAHDKDSGIYGQVIYSLESDQLEDLDLFSVSTMNNRAELKLVGEYFHEKKKKDLLSLANFHLTKF